ncbi:DUF6934 family protein [Dyadobacter sp. OTU695]|uniref:DUF6934 family protein n=1 Tax=Dyadobacter sp. OTU695 TaxID=3043860 RepID=UPI00406C7835
MMSNKEVYAVHSVPGTHIFTFVSEGFYGRIRKMIIIDPIRRPLIDVPHGKHYNLAFGDIRIKSDEWTIDDSVRTNNGDMPKVIATVAQVAVRFLRENKKAVLFFQGYLDSKSIRAGRNQRNLLYQRAIESNWDCLSSEFLIQGIQSGKIVDYVRGIEYEEILIRRK